MAFGSTQSQSNEVDKINKIPVPNGFQRKNYTISSFSNYLQNLKLTTTRKQVLLYNGEVKNNQNVHFAILDMDVGDKDLQQCADAIIRLRAEYLWNSNQKEKIHFNFTSGDTAFYRDYKNGIRPKISGNKVSWENTNNADSSYETFRNYLETVFTYAGTFSLNKELVKVPDPEQLQVGDVFIRTGNPYGHAVIIVDLAENKDTGEIVFLN